jgi:hypothetical protein
MKISKRKLSALVLEAAKKIFESNGQGQTLDTSDANLYLKVNVGFLKIVDKADIIEKAKPRNLRKRFVYINREGEEVFKQRKYMEERQRLLGIIDQINKSGGLQSTAQESVAIYFNVSRLGIPQVAVNAIKDIINTNREDYLFDIASVIPTIEDRKIKKQVGAITKLAVGAIVSKLNDDEALKRAVRGVFPTNVSIDINKSRVVPGITSFALIDSNEYVLQAFGAESQDKVLGYTVPEEEEEVTEYKNKETGEVIATAQEIQMVHNLAHKRNTPANRLFAASQPYAPLRALKKLVRDPRPEVRMAVVYNPRTTEAMMEMLSNDSDADVATAATMKIRGITDEKLLAAQNPETSPSVLMQLSRDSRFDIKMAVLRNPSVTSDVVEALKGDRYRAIATAAAKKEAGELESFTPGVVDDPVNYRVRSAGSQAAEAELKARKKEIVRMIQIVLPNVTRAIDEKEEGLKQKIAVSSNQEKIAKLNKKLKDLVADRGNVIKEIEDLEKELAEIDKKLEGNQAPPPPLSPAEQIAADQAARIERGREKFRRRSAAIDAITPEEREARRQAAIRRMEAQKGGGSTGEEAKRLEILNDASLNPKQKIIKYYTYLKDIGKKDEEIVRRVAAFKKTIAGKK